ncbi:MAG: hypothetical protein CL569_04125 [Alphaproteobacteria bacterium]|nr:hypothetical protein [Alphaproteobacteria bacterium]
MAREPALPRRNGRRPYRQLNSRAGGRSDHGAAGELVPQRMCLLVVHQLVRPVEKSGGAEDETFRPAFDMGFE